MPLLWVLQEVQQEAVVGNTPLTVKGLGSISRWEGTSGSTPVCREVQI